jgi:ribosome-binding factor A
MTTIINTNIADMTAIINTRIDTLTQWVQQVQAGNDAKHADIYKRLIKVEEEMNEEMDVDGMNTDDMEY